MRQIHTYDEHPHHNTTAVELTYRELRALLEHASRDETREHLCGIALDPDNGCAAATDGHRLLLLRVPDMGTTMDAPAVVPRATVELWMAVAKTRKACVAVSCSPEAITATVGDDPPMVCPRPDVIFPPVAQVIPARLDDRERRSCETTGINPKYLAALVLVSEACGDSPCKAGTHSGCPSVVQSPAGSMYDPLRFDAVGPSCSAVVVIMPCKTKDNPAPSPEMDDTIDAQRRETIRSLREEHKHCEAFLKSARDERDAMQADLLEAQERANALHSARVGDRDMYRSRVASLETELARREAEATIHCEIMESPPTQRYGSAYAA